MIIVFFFKKQETSIPARKRSDKTTVCKLLRSKCFFVITSRFKMRLNGCLFEPVRFLAVGCHSGVISSVRFTFQSIATDPRVGRRSTMRTGRVYRNPHVRTTKPNDENDGVIQFEDENKTCSRQASAGRATFCALRCRTPRDSSTERTRRFRRVDDGSDETETTRNASEFVRKLASTIRELGRTALTARRVPAGISAS